MGIASGPDGHLWYTDWVGDKIGRVTTSGTVTTYSLPAESEPLGITVGPDGMLWFANQGTNKIGTIVP